MHKQRATHRSARLAASNVVLGMVTGLLVVAALLVSVVGRNGDG